MDITTTVGEIIKKIRIDNFSSYSGIDEEITSQIYVNIHNFRSEWKLIVIPMHPNKPQETSSVHCDATIELVCLTCSAPFQAVENINISITIKGRENYPITLTQIPNETNPYWRNILIPRVTLNSLKLLVKNVFQFDIKFIIPEDTLQRSVDGKSVIAKHIETILRDPQYSDTCLVSSTGSKFYVHAAVLHARSNILKTAKVISLSHTHELNNEIIHNHKDNTNSSHELISDISKQDKDFKNPLLESNSNSSSSSYGSSSFAKDYHNGSPYKHNTPLFTLPTNKSISDGLRSPLSSPIKLENNPKRESPSVSASQKCSTKRLMSPPAGSPKKRGTSKSRPGTPQKPSLDQTMSPSKQMTQTQLTNFFPRSSSLNSNIKPEENSLLQTYLSPIKNQTPSLNSPSKFGPKINSPLAKNFSKENTPKKESALTKMFSRSADIKSPCTSIPKLNFQKRKLFEVDLEDSSRNVTILKVNISTSVLQELLNWIYTGESSRLHELAQPLLVAALRHNVEDLSRASQFHLASLLSLNNVCERLFLSQKYDASILKEEAMRFALSHANEVTSTHAWNHLMVDNSQLLLSFTRRLAASKI